MKQVFIEICEDAESEFLALQHYKGRAVLSFNMKGIAVNTTNKRKGTDDPVNVDETMSPGKDIRILVFRQGD